MDADIHIDGNTRISVNPPSTSDASLSIKNTELITAKNLLESAAHSDARLTGSYDNYRVIGIAIGIVAISFLDRRPKPR
jgi:hypothetical protein